MTAFTVGLADVTAALTSVVAHADPDPDHTVLHRVHLALDPVNVTVTATNRYTAGLAIVSVEEHHDGTLDGVDLTPGDVKKVLALFKPGRQAVDEMLRIDVTTGHVTFTDVSGLFPGQSLTLVRTADAENYPDVAQVVSAALSRPSRAARDQIVAAGSLLRLFTVAARSYAAPLSIEPTGKSALLIACGESFLGLLMPMVLDAEATAEMGRWRRAWRDRLPEPLPDTRVVIEVNVEDLADYDRPIDDPADHAGEEEPS